MEKSLLNFIPQYLTTEEIGNPYLKLRSFIDNFGLHSSLMNIETWMDALCESVVWDYDNPANLLYFYERMLGLLEAAWLIKDLDNDQRLANIEEEHSNNKNYDLFNRDLFCKVNYFQSDWEHFPRNVSLEQYINPYNIFPDIFEDDTLDEWKEMLHQTLQVALSEETMEDTADFFNVLKIKRRLSGLVEVCQLISVREFVFQDGELRLRTRTELIHVNDNENDKNTAGEDQNI